MKKVMAVLLIIMCLPLFAQENEFEGKATFKVSSHEGGAEFDYFVKDGSYRMDLKNEGETVSIIQTDTKMTILMHDNNMYMEFPKSMMDMMRQQQQKDFSDENRENYEPTITGNKKEILGYETEEWEFKDEENNRVVMWVTDEVGNFMFIDSPMQQMKRPSWQQSISDKGYFPLMITVIDPSDDEVAIWEVTDLKEMELSDEQFNAPGDYEKMDMQQMMQKMQNKGSK